MRFVFKPSLITRIFILLILLLTSSVIYASSATIKKISADIVDNTLHMEITLNQAVKYHYFSLTSPDRLVIDFDDTPTSAATLPTFPKNSWVKALRIGPHSATTQRMVIELTQAVTAKLNLSPAAPNWLLKVDLQLANQKTANTNKQINPNVKKELVPILENTEPQSSQKNSIITKIANAHPKHCISIVIDPGHGGHDPGAIGTNGIKEKNVTLAISKYLNDLINQTSGMCAYMTRTTDDFVTLRGRLDFARKKSADLFIAIHADNFQNSTARGATVFALSQHGATNEAARWIAHNENLSDLLDIGEVENKDKDLQSVLMDISQNETINRSLVLGKYVLKNLDDVSKLHHVIVEQAGFVVLKAPDIPSILVETGFLSNTYEEKQLSQSSYQKKIALAIYRGIIGYSKQYSSSSVKTSAGKT